MIAILDYGIGNLASVQNAFCYLGIACTTISTPEELVGKSGLVLPGVGSFAEGMRKLDESGLAESLQHQVTANKTPLLGICLGMQMLGISSCEDGFTPGLGFIDAKVELFSRDSLAEHKLKSPHVGFNRVEFSTKSVLSSGLGTAADFYFTHSYRMMPPDDCASTCLHGESFAAIVEKGNVFGTQFHPEKSQKNGLMILKNFSQLCDSSLQK